jgi:hypothetical protein
MNEYPLLRKALFIYFLVHLVQYSTDFSRKSFSDDWRWVLLNILLFGFGYFFFLSGVVTYTLYAADCCC